MALISIEVEGEQMASLPVVRVGLALTTSNESRPRSLPIELLQAIFEYFVLVLLGRPSILCTVSRKWRIAALLAPKLWSRIVIVAANPKPPRRRRGPDPSYTICKTEERLQTLLERAGSVLLDVCLDLDIVETLPDAWTTIDRDWLTKRCRKLMLTPFNPATITRVRSTWIHDLVTLEEVVFSREMPLPVDLYEDLQNNSVKLFSMEMGAPDMDKLTQFPALMARLRILRVLLSARSASKLDTMDLPSLDSVEELHWPVLSFSNPLLPTTTRLRILTLAYCRYVDVDQVAWVSLTELTFRYSHLSVQPTLVLPALRTLTLYGDWQELSWIRAPTLIMLRIFSYTWPAQHDRALIASTLRPRVVYMEMLKATTIQRLILEEVCSEVEELHCIYDTMEGSESFIERLLPHPSQAWSTDGKAEVCPHLREFTAVFDCNMDDVATVSAMEAMVKSRSSFHPLTVARLGIETCNVYGESTEWTSFV